MDRLTYHEEHPVGLHKIVYPPGTDRHAIKILSDCAKRDITVWIAYLQIGAQWRYVGPNLGYDKGYVRIEWQDFVSLASTSTSYSRRVFDPSRIIAMRPGQIRMCDKEGWWYWVPELLSPVKEKREKDHIPLVQTTPLMETITYQAWAHHPWQIELGGRYQCEKLDKMI
jgi:hypothetical protein